MTVRVAGDDDAVAVAVRDHGVGLEPADVTMVFNRFWRADPARARTTGGTGLGLSIALEDAHLHGGWLQAWGEPGDGCQFRLTVPRRQGGELEGSPIPLEPTDSARRARPVTVGDAVPPGRHPGRRRCVARRRPQQWRSRWWRPAVVLLLAAVLPACATIPTSGPVRADRDLRLEREDVAVPFIAEGPLPGATGPGRARLPAGQRGLPARPRGRPATTSRRGRARSGGRRRARPCTTAAVAR